MKFSTKKILILVSVLVLIFLSGYAFLFFGIKWKNEKSFVLSQEIDEYVIRESTLKSNDKTAQDLASQINLLGPYFVKEADVVSFIEIIEDAGKKNDAVVTIGTIGVVVGGDESVKQQTLSLRFDAKGSWSNLRNLISYLENLPYKITFEKVSLNAEFSPVPFFKDPEIEGVEKSDLQTWGGVFEINVVTHK